MKKGLLLRGPLPLLIFLTACTPKVVHYLDEQANYKSFESYELVNVKIGKRKIDPDATELLGTIESRIQYHMQDQRGYATSNVSPDLTLRYELVSNTRADNRANNSIFSAPTVNLRVIYQSVVLLELLKGKKLIWQGSYDLTQTKKEARNQKSINKAIDLIFTTYPYRAGSSNKDTSLTNTKKK